MHRVKFRKLPYCPKCFSRTSIDLDFMYITDSKGFGNKIEKRMELHINCDYCKETFKLKMEGVIKL